MTGTHKEGAAAPAANEISLVAYRQELAELVNIDSGTADIAGVATMAERMAEKYRALGWHVEFADLGSVVGPGLVATNKPGAAQYDVLLYALPDADAQEDFLARMPLRGHVDGVVLLAVSLTGDQQKSLLELGLPMVSVGDPLLQSFSVGIDNEGYFTEAVTAEPDVSSSCRWPRCPRRSGASMR